MEVLKVGRCGMEKSKTYKEPVFKLGNKIKVDADF